MNLELFKARLIVVIMIFSFCLMARAYGNYSEDMCCEAPQQTCGDFIFKADFLVLRPYEKMSDHCAFNQVINIVDSDGNVLTTIENRHSHSNFKWQPAFRIGAGYAMKEWSWKYGIFWTHLNSKYHAGHENKRKWCLNFDTIDAIAAYTFYGNCCFSLTCFGGLRGARIDQNIHLITVLDNLIHNKDKQNFWGVGPLIGIETDCKMGCGLSLYANIAASWLYGKYAIKQNDLSLFDTGSTSFEGRKHIFANQFVTDAGFGVQWGTVLYNHNLFLRLGFEHHHYFDYNYFENSDLSLSGANISAAFEF